MYYPKYSIFYDFHTSPDFTVVGDLFNADEFTERLKRCGIDYMTFHVRCNMGMAYYDTAVGIRHPGLGFDLFGRLAEACQSRNIALTAYFNGGLSQAEWLKHPEWGVIGFDGKVLDDERLSPVIRPMCYNTPYRDHLIAMVREVAEKYPVAGFFIDCLSIRPCICPVCIKEMKERGIDWRDEAAVRDFSAFSASRLSKDIADAAKSFNPEYLLYFNCVSYESQIDYGTYLELECIPSRECWGYEFLPVMSRYMRTLSDGPLLNMTARFFSWGDFGGLRPSEALKSELLNGLANGMRPNIGDHFLPHGDLCLPVLDEVEKIYGELQAMEPWFDQAKPQAEIAVVYPKDVHNIRYDAELRGVVRMLCELQQQFDIVTMVADWSKYSLLIFPDDVVFDQAISERVEKHLRNGGKIIASGWSGLDPEHRNFVFPEAWGCDYHGDCEFKPAYFAAKDKFSNGLPNMPLSIYDDGILLRPRPETLVAANLVKPLINKQWTGLYPEYYTPPETETAWPFITINNQVAHFSHALFKGYKQKAPPHLRRIFANVLEQLWPAPLLKIANSPSFLRSTVTRQPGRDNIHLLAYIAEKRGSESELIEDELTVNDLQVYWRSDNRMPRQVYLAPQERKLNYAQDGDYICIQLPEMKGHALIAVEY